jgi:putative transposase
MPNYRRSYVKGGTYFFTVNTSHRQPILTHPRVRAILRKAVIEARNRYPFEINAWALLPDHLHCIWTLPGNDKDYSGRWAFIKRFTTKHCKELFENQNLLTNSNIKRSESTIWQRRFWEHLIRDEEDYIAHTDYIYWNPVKHGYVKRARDWPYSTFHRDVKQGIYHRDWGEWSR